MGNAGNSARKVGALFGGLSLVVNFSTPVFAACADPLKLAPQFGAFKFHQARVFKDIPQPLNADGVMTVASDKVVWRTTSPINIVTEITPTGITQSVEGGPPQPVAKSMADPFIRSSGLFEILTGRYEALAQYYRLESTSTEAKWQIALTPRAPDMARFIAGIQIEGCAAPASVRIRQVNGDEMSVTWAAVSP